MGNILACILIFIGISLGERFSAYINGGYVSLAFRRAKVLIIILLIASILRACGIV